MRYLKSPMFVAGLVLLGCAFLATRPSPQVDFAGASWSVSMPMRISLASIGAVIVGMGLVAASVIRLRAGHTRD